jgi:hypothetical protein
VNVARIAPFLAKYAQKLLGLFPAPLPKGASEFDSFCKKVLSTYSLPDEPSYRHTIATMILQLSPTTATKSPHYFAVSVRKAMSNQVAYNAIQMIREEEKQKESAEKASRDEAIPN